MDFFHLPSGSLSTEGRVLSSCSHFPTVSFPAPQHSHLTEAWHPVRAQQMWEEQQHLKARSRTTVIRVKASHGRRQVRKRPFCAFTVKEDFTKFTLGQVIMSSGSTVGPKRMTGWSIWWKQDDKSETGCLVRRLWWIWGVTNCKKKKTTGTAALQSRENQRLLMKGRINKAGGDLAGGREAGNQSDQPQSVLKGRLEPGGSLEERSWGLLIGPSRARQSGRQRGESVSRCVFGEEEDGGVQELMVKGAVQVTWKFVGMNVP